MPNSSQTWLLRYGVALLSIALATGFRLMLDPILGERAPFATLFFGILLAAWYGGFGPALAATAVSFVGSVWLLFPPRGSMVVESLENRASLFLYLAAGLGIALLGGAMRAAQRRAEAKEREALRQRDQFQTILASIGDGVAVTDAAGRVTLLNPVAEALTGWNSVEAASQSLETVFHIINEGTGKLAENPVTKVLREEIVVGLANHTLLISRDGTERSIDDSAAPIRDNNGNLTGVVLVFRDITGRRQTERELDEQRQRLRVTLASIGDAVMATDIKGRVTLMNPVAQALTGWTEAEARGQFLHAVFQIINEQTRQPIESPVIPALRRGSAVGLANHALLVARDGTERPIDDSAAPIQDEGGNILGVVLTFRDMSERRRLEQDRRHLAAIVESSDEAIYSKNLHGIITSWNAAAERLYGYSATEMIGKSISVLVPLEKMGELADIMDKLRRGERTDLFETKRRRKDGTLVWVSLSVSPVRDGAGELIGDSVMARDISRQKQAEEEIRRLNRDLQRRVAEFQTLLDVLPVGIAVAEDPECRHIWPNPTLAKWLRLPPNTNASIHVPPEERPNFQICCNGRELSIDELPLQTAIVTGQEVRDIDLEFVFPDGEILRFLACAAPLFDENNQVRGAIFAGVDITARKQAVEELREAEARTRSMVDHVLDGIITIDHQGRIQTFNPAAERIFGYTAAEVAGQNVKLLMPEPYRVEHDSYLENYLRTGEARIIGTGREMVGRRRDGSTFPMDLAVSEFYLNGQRFFTGIVRDITERKRVEQSLRFLAEASVTLAGLVDYRSTLQKVAMLAVPDFADWCAVDMLEEDGTLRRLAVAHVDLNKVELAHEIYRRWPPNPDSSANIGVYHILRTGESEIFPEIPQELLERVARDEEHLRIIRELGLKSYMGVPLTVRGKPAGAIIFVAAESGRRYDVNDLAVAEELANRASIAIENARLYTELREADRRKDEFLAILAHELRNPLAPIRTALQILRSPRADAATVEQVKGMMERQVEHLVRLVDDLLDVSRIMRGKIELRKERVDLATVVSRAVETAQPVIDAQGHHLEITLPPEPVEMDADPVRLAQIISNLLTNAAKYTEQTGKIWLTAVRENGAVVMRVRDTGVGIAPEMLSRIFELFTQVSVASNRAQGGLGIGLTLVKNLVEMHGGTVQAHSAGPGQGSEFVVYLPEAKASLSGEKPVKSDTPPGPLSQRRILVVDDNVDAARSLTLLLSMEGQQAQMVHDGSSALELVESFQPEVVILDIGMPGMDGYEVARRLRRLPGGDKLTLIALTGWGQEEDRRRSREAGFDYHLTKPIELAPLQIVLAGISSDRS